MLILAGNAYIGHWVPELENRVMPFSTRILATEPLGGRAKEILPSDMCVEDVRYVLDYYRLSADRRLLFGGGTVYGGTDPADIRAKLVPNLEKIFPQFKGIKIDFAWSGNCALSFSRVPQMGRLGASHTSPRATAVTVSSAATCSGRFSRRQCMATAPASTCFKACRGSLSRRPAVCSALFSARVVVVRPARPAGHLNLEPRGH